MYSSDLQNFKSNVIEGLNQQICSEHGPVNTGGFCGAVWRFQRHGDALINGSSEFAVLRKLVIEEQEERMSRRIVLRGVCLDRQAIHAIGA